MNAHQPLILTAAINGAETTREQHPLLPITPEEVGAEALRCQEEGASVIHLHGRTPEGLPSQSIESFRSYFEAIRATGPAIVQFSTGGAVGMALEERIEALCLMPEMASLTTGSCNFGDGVFANPLPDVREIARRLRQFAVVPEIEVFDLSMLEAAESLVGEGLLRAPLHINFVLGVPGALRATEDNVRLLASRVPEGWTWGVTGVGRHEMPMAALAIAWGGHVRVGLEDNLYAAKGELAQGSWHLVQIVAEMARNIGRPVATVPEARSLLRCPEVRYPTG